jgi:hypothetical protein
MLILKSRGALDVVELGSGLLGLEDDVVGKVPTTLTEMDQEEDIAMTCFGCCRS